MFDQSRSSAQCAVGRLTRWFGAFAACGLAAVAMAASPQGPSSVTPLLTYASTSQLSSNSEQKSAVASVVQSRGLPSGGREALLNPSALLASNPGDVFSFAAPGRAIAHFVTERIGRSTNGTVTWVGKHVEGEGLAKRAYVSVHENAFSATFETPESVFDLYDISPPTDATQKNVTLNRTAYIVDHAEIGTSRPIPTLPDSMPELPTLPKPVELEPADQSKSATVSPLAAPSPQSQIDIMFAYTSGMEAQYGDANGVIARLGTLVQWANTAYINSEVAITLNMVHTVLVNHPDTGPSNFARLASLINGSGAGLSGVAVLANTHYADLVSLVRVYDGSHGNCGLASARGINGADMGQFGGPAYSIISNGTCGTGILAHEIGHNMGLQHDRPNQDGTAPFATPYGYGYGYNYGSNPNNAQYGDVMSYAFNWVQAYSSPNLKCFGSSCTYDPLGSGTPLGIAADSPVEACLTSAAGCPATSAAACTTNPGICADAARALNFVRVKVAKWGSPTRTISGVIANGNTPVPGVTLCAQPQAGVSCTTSTATGSYSCTIPSGWSGVLHSPMVGSNRIFGGQFPSMTADFTYNPWVTTGTPACNLDVDNNGLYEPEIDGRAILMRVAGFNASAFAGLSGACAANTSASAIYAAVDASFQAGGYDVTGSGGTKLLSDGAVFMRILRGVRGNAVVDGLGIASETSNTWLATWTGVKNSVNGGCAFPALQ